MCVEPFLSEERFAVKSVVGIKFLKFGVLSV